MRNIIKIWFIIIIISGTSCVYDPPPPSVRIFNSSNDTVKLIVNYNKLLFYDFRPEINMSKIKLYKGDWLGDGKSIVDFDTTMLIGTYLLEPDCRFSLRFHSRSKLDFKFDTIKVINGMDTLKVYGSLDSLYLFTKRKFQQYELTIK